MYPSAQSITLVPRTSRRTRRRRREAMVVPDGLPVYMPPLTSTRTGVWPGVPFQVSSSFSSCPSFFNRSENLGRRPCFLVR